MIKQKENELKRKERKMRDRQNIEEGNEKRVIKAKRWKGKGKETERKE